MKIVQILTELRPAGAERIVTDLCECLKKNGHETTVVSLLEPPEKSIILDELRENSVKIISLGLKKTAPWRAFKLKKIIDEIDPDIVHSHLIHRNLIARICLRNRKYKLVNTVHIAERRKGKWWHFTLDKLTGKLCDVQTAVSRAVRDFHSEKTGRNPESMPVIHNGIKKPASFDKTQIDALKKEWNLQDCAKIIGSVGRLDWQKGYDIFLSMLHGISQIIPENEKWGIVIIGEGPEREKLERFMESCPENIAIKLPGYRNDAASCIGAFDLFVMPSRYEGFGLVLAEAMAHGIPVLVNETDSLPELIENYKNAEKVVFEKSNKAEIIEKIKSLVRHEKIEPFLEFGTDSMAEEYINLYKNLM
jgi:glycosyltransferase involved in cell wall biosynthesis